VATAGGKGSSLGRKAKKKITNLSFLLPKGFVCLYDLYALINTRKKSIKNILSLKG